MKLHLELKFCSLFRLLDNDFLYNCLLMNLLIQNIFRFWGGGFDVQYMQIAVGGPKCPFSLKNVKITVLHCAACIFWIDLCINFKHGCNNGLHHQEAPLALGFIFKDSVRLWRVSTCPISRVWFQWTGGMWEVLVPRGYNTEDGEYWTSVFLGLGLESARHLKYTNSDYNLSSKRWY